MNMQSPDPEKYVQRKLEIKWKIEKGKNFNLKNSKQREVAP